MERKDNYSEALASKGKFGKHEALACCHFSSLIDGPWRVRWQVDDDMENKRWSIRVIDGGLILFSYDRLSFVSLI